MGQKVWALHFREMMRWRMRRLARKSRTSYGVLARDRAHAAPSGHKQQQTPALPSSCVEVSSLYRRHSSNLATTMAETILFIVCIFLIAALDVSASSSALPAQAAAAVASRTWTCDAMMKLPRGGGAGAASNGGSSGSRFGRLPFVGSRVNRRAELQEEVRNLESKLRKSYDEVSILRTQLRSAASSDRSASAKLVRESAAIRQQLKDEVDVLRDMVEKLEAARSELEEMLVKETERADAAEARVAEVESRAKVEMEQLRTTLLDKSRKELEAAEEAAEKRLEMEVKRLEKDADERVEEAKRKGIKALEDERSNGAKALEDERSNGAKALEDERERFRKAIEAEVARSKAAVDSEKSKMKKVLEAIAAEEQKETVPVDTDIDAVKSSKKSTGKKKKSGSGSSSSSSKKKKKATTITGASASGTTAGGKKSVSSVRGTTY